MASAPTRSPGSVPTSAKRTRSPPNTGPSVQDLTNRLAFEHLSVDAMKDLLWVQNAGSVFVGKFSPQSMGDYVSGPNHVLPTGRAGRVRGGLSVMDFCKVITAAALRSEFLARRAKVRSHRTTPTSPHCESAPVLAVPLGVLRGLTFGPLEFGPQEFWEA